MSFSDNEKIIKGLAFEKAVIKVLMLDNPELLTEYPYTIPNCDISYHNDMLDFRTRKIRFDAFAKGKLNLSCFGKGIVRAENIAVEIKAGRVSSMIVNQVFKLYSYLCGMQNACLVLITAGKVTEKYVDMIKSKMNCQLVIVDESDLIKNKIIRKVLYGFDDYIIENDNVLIDNYYPEVRNLQRNISFALGAGCSINSNISDWNRLSEALGFELLYNVVDIKDSAYKNMMITNELNKKLFSCYEKNSALDAIYNAYMSSPSVTKLDYYNTIKKIIYMSYDNPFDANKDLLTSINDCIKRHNVKEIINYNFDSVLEQNYNNKYKSSSVEVSNAKTKIGGCTIFHVHGYIPHDYNGKTPVNDFVFTDKEYYDNMMNPHNNCNTIQRRILNTYNVIFVGVSFVDTNMKERLRERMMQAYSNKVFAFLKLPKFDGKGTEIKVMESKYKFIQQTYFDSLGVKILWVNEYDDIPKEIDKI